MDTYLPAPEAEYFANFEGLFNHPGWAQLVSELKQEADQIPEVAFLSSASIEQLHSARSMYRTLYYVINKPDEMMIRLRNALAEREEATRQDEMPAEIDP